MEKSTIHDRDHSHPPCILAATTTKIRQKGEKTDSRALEGALSRPFTFQKISMPTPREKTPTRRWVWGWCRHFFVQPRLQAGEQRFLIICSRKGQGIQCIENISNAQSFHAALACPRRILFSSISIRSCVRTRSLSWHRHASRCLLKTMLKSISLHMTCATPKHTPTSPPL